MQTDAHVPITARDFAVPRTSLVTALLLASLFPAWAVLRGLSMSLYFSPTDTALYAARVGHALLGPAAVATLVLLAIAAGVRWTAPDPSRALTAGVAVAIMTVLSLVGLAWVVADRAMHPFGPEMRAVAAFSPPPAARHAWDGSRASDRPEFSRHWEAPGSLEAVCADAVARFEAWAHPAPAVNVLPRSGRSCYYRAQQERHRIELNVSDYGAPAGTVRLSVTVRRA